MPRSARFVLPGIPHHVTQRGIRRLPTFFDDSDYRLYATLVKAGTARAGTAVWAWCLMPNHVHLILVPSREDGLRAALAEAHRRYAGRINARERWRGHLWQARFASFPMDEPHLLACARYVELNPVRAGLVRRPEDWRWSSARAHLGLGADALGDPGPLLERVPDWATLLEGGLAEREREAIRESELSGRPLGGEAFLDSVETRLGRSVRPRPPGRPPKTGDSM